MINISHCFQGANKKCKARDAKYKSTDWLEKHIQLSLETNLEKDEVVAINSRYFMQLVKWMT